MKWKMPPLRVAPHLTLERSRIENLRSQCARFIGNRASILHAAPLDIKAARPGTLRQCLTLLVRILLEHADDSRWKSATVAHHTSCRPMAFTLVIESNRL